MRIVLLHALCTASLVALPLGCDHTPAPAGTGYAQSEASADGIGRTYYGREIAAFMSHQGIYWLERGTRESEERTDLLMDGISSRA